MSIKYDFDAALEVSQLLPIARAKLKSATDEKEIEVLRAMVGQFEMMNKMSLKSFRPRSFNMWFKEMAAMLSLEFKNHSEYAGRKQTGITRVKISK